MAAERQHNAAKQENDAGEARGCGAMVVSTLLFAAERYLLFLTLTQSSMGTPSAASQTHRFLFGDPPFSLFDVLLGFQIPDEGGVFLLQPHNLLLAFTQAVHFGLCLGIVHFLL